MEADKIEELLTATGADEAQKDKLEAMKAKIIQNARQKGLLDGIDDAEIEAVSQNADMGMIALLVMLCFGYANRSDENGKTP